MVRAEWTRSDWVTEGLMNTQTVSRAVEKSVPVDSEMEAELGNIVEQSPPKRRAQIETEVERIRSSVARLTSNSIDGLAGLTSELQELQKFLNSEVQRVQSEIESALAGIKIIMETIAPWKSSPVPAAPVTTPRPIRSGPAANIESTPARR